jgi:integrase
VATTDPLPRSPLERQIISILAANREDSYATQRQRAMHVKEACRIIETKFGLQKLANLGLKHVTAVVESWRLAHAGKRVLENKLSDLRWMVRKIGKQNLLPRSNSELGIEPAARHTRAGKIVSEEKWREILGAVQHPVVRAQLLLARYFGLRFEETALFRPHQDVDGNRVWIKRGAKGGKPRYVVIRSEKQREALDAARAVAVPGRGVIPVEARTFKAWADKVYEMLRAIGVGQATDTTFHDLRRTFADERMREIMAARGCSREEAAKLVARELGHGRTEVLDWYLPDPDASEPESDEAGGAAA